MNTLKIKLFLQKHKRIEVNNKLIKLLGYSDMRDFTKELGDWGHGRDFTYLTKRTEDWQTHLRLFIKENFLE